MITKVTPLGNNKVLKITKEDDNRWSITYRWGASYSFTIVDKDYKEALREVYRYAKSKRATKEELSQIETIATSDMFRKWTATQ